MTGRDIAPTLAFARRLAARRQPVWVRFVLVPGWTDDPGDVADLARFAAVLGNVERVDVLPFHALGAAQVRRARPGLPLRRGEPAVRRAGRGVRAAFTGAGLLAV